MRVWWAADVTGTSLESYDNIRARESRSQLPLLPRRMEVSRGTLVSREEALTLRPPG